VWQHQSFVPSFSILTAHPHRALQLIERKKEELEKPRVGGCNPAAPLRQDEILKNEGFVNMIVSKILRDLHFSLYQSPKSDDD
jgi:hypothetical protein